MGGPQQLPEPLSRALDARIAPQGLAGVAIGGRRRPRRAQPCELLCARLRGRASCRRLGEGMGDRAPGEHEALAQRVGGQPVGAVQPRAGGLAHRIKSRQRRAGVEVGENPSHHVVGRRRDRDQLLRGVQARFAQRADHVGKASGVDHAHVQAHGSLTGLLQASLDRLGDLIPGKQLVDEALAPRIQERRPLAADRLGDEEAFPPRHADHGGGVKLKQLQVR